MTMWPQRRDMSPFQDELEKWFMWRTRKQRITRMQRQKGMRNNSHHHIGIPEQECNYFQTRNNSEIALRNALSTNMLRLYTWGYKGEYTQHTSKDRKIYYNTIRKSKKSWVKAQESHITIVYVLWHWQKPESKQRGWQIPPQHERRVCRDYLPQVTNTMQHHGQSRTLTQPESHHTSQNEDL